MTFFMIMLIIIVIVTIKDSCIIFLVHTEGDEGKHHLQDCTQLPVPVHVLWGREPKTHTHTHTLKCLHILWGEITFILCFLLQKESPDLSRQSPANGHASVTSSILVSFCFFSSLWHTEKGKSRIRHYWHWHDIINYRCFFEWLLFVLVIQF